MKLIDILVRELPKRGGWPRGMKEVAQSIIDGELYFYDSIYDGTGAALKMDCGEMCDDDKGFTKLPVVTFKQYQAALAASKTEWDGVGLPPVGAEVECICNEFPNDGQEKLFGHILYAGEYTILKTYKTNNQHHAPVESVFKTKSWAIIPIRSEADKKRDAAIERMVKVIGITPESAAICYEISLSGGV